jgi:hypothetical protein
METAHWALTVSILSLLVAGTSLGVSARKVGFDKRAKIYELKVALLTKIVALQARAANQASVIEKTLAFAQQIGDADLYKLAQRVKDAGTSLALLKVADQLELLKDADVVTAHVENMHKLHALELAMDEAAPMLASIEAAVKRKQSERDN